MSDGFNRKEVEDLLVACHRRCCICHRFCGVKMEIDHIEQRADGGSNEIENAIPVCFECHAEIHSYNDKHPKGRKFTSREIKLHKGQWLKLCKTRPEVFTEPPREYDVGPISALIDELEFNHHIATSSDGEFQCPFREIQFQKAISAGAISMLIDEVKTPLLNAYGQIGKVNQAVSVYLYNTDRRDKIALMQWHMEIDKSASLILEAKNKLTNFLKSED